MRFHEINPDEIRVAVAAMRARMGEDPQQCQKAVIDPEPVVMPKVAVMIANRTCRTQGCNNPPRKGVRGARAVYCSEEHRKAAEQAVYARHSAKHKRECVYRPKVDRSTPAAKAAINAAAKAKGEARRALEPDKVCWHCKVPFRHLVKRKYCSTECYEKNLSETRIALRDCARYPRKCLHCSRNTPSSRNKICGAQLCRLTQNMLVQRIRRSK